MKLRNELQKVKMNLTGKMNKISLGFVAFAMTVLLPMNAYAAGLDVSKSQTAIVDLIYSLLNPMLAIVVALGMLYSIVLGVKYAKAEEPQEREKAKAHLKNAIIGFVLIFVLMLVLKVTEQPLKDWVNTNAGTNVLQ